MKAFSKTKSQSKWNETKCEVWDEAVKFDINFINVMWCAVQPQLWIELSMIEISNGGLERQREGGGEKQRKANEKSERDFWPRETFNISPFEKWIHCIRSCHWAIVTLASHTVRNVVNLGITQLNETWKIIYESENRQKALQLSLWQQIRLTEAKGKQKKKQFNSTSIFSVAKKETRIKKI